MGDIKGIGDKLLKSAFAPSYLAEMISSDPFVDPAVGEALKRAVYEPALFEGRPDLQKLYHDVLSRRKKVGYDMPMFRWYGGDLGRVQMAWKEVLDAKQEPVWPKVRLGDKRKADVTKVVFAYREDPTGSAAFAKPEGIVAFDAEDWSFVEHLKRLLQEMPREEGMRNVPAIFDAESRLLFIGADGGTKIEDLEAEAKRKVDLGSARLLAVSIVADRTAELIALFADGEEIDGTPLAEEEYRDRLSLLRRLFEPYTLNPWDAWHHPNPRADAFATPLAFNPSVFINDPFRGGAKAAKAAPGRGSAAGKGSFGGVVVEEEPETGPSDGMMPQLEAEAAAMADAINGNGLNADGTEAQVSSAPNAGPAVRPVIPGLVGK